MTSSIETTAPPVPEARWKIVLAAVVIMLAALVAYHNSFEGPFVFDDSWAILQNPTIRLPVSISGLFSPPPQCTVAGRPLANATLAINYATSGTDVRGYHALNLLIHLCAGLALFGVVRRTLVKPLEEDATLVACAIALLWTVHPLQTEAVTYIVQRTESLMGLFYLLTLYCFIRGVELQEAGGLAPGRRNPWFVLSVGACLLGMGSKEVMVSAPVMVFLYDRTFIAGTFRDAWQRRRRVYLGLAATWIFLGWLVASIGGNRGGTTGVGSGASPWDYALTQFPAVIKYLWLSFWPHPLVFDYGAQWVKHPLDVLPSALLLIAIVAGTLYALKRQPVLGFAGAWFFSILAPSSMVPGPRQTMAEHRMYLALAAVIAVAVLAVYAWGGRRTLIAWFAVALGLVSLTVSRNRDYRSELSVWSNAVAHCPTNHWTQVNLGMALYDRGRIGEAIEHFKQALLLEPEDSGAHNDLGLALAKLGRVTEAVAQYEAALKARPNFSEAENNLGLALLSLNRPADAVAHLETALRLAPKLASLHFNLGKALEKAGRIDDAIIRYKQALQINPNESEACTNLGNIYNRMGRTSEAISWYETAVSTNPGDAIAQYDLAIALTQVGRNSEAIDHFQAELRLRPDDAEARDRLNQLLNFERGYQ